VIELRVLGPPGIHAPNGGLTRARLPHRKRLALLAYLAAATPRGAHRRDTLLAIFWPESDDEHARAALSQALYVLRRQLGDDAFLGLGNDEVALNPQALWCDAAAFEATLDAGRPEEAVALYRGDLLEGFLIRGAPDFAHWVDRERRRLRQRASEALWTLAEAGASGGYAMEAARYAARAAELAPGDEVVVRRLMSFLRALGDRAAAMRTYDAFVAQLVRDYELEPSEETRALAASLRAEQPRSVGRGLRAGQPRHTADAIPAPVVPPTWDAPPPPRARRSGSALVVLTLTVLASTAVLWSSRAADRVSDAEWVTLLGLGDAPRLAEGVAGSTIVLSPAGDLVYVGEDTQGRRLFLKRSGAASPSRIPGTEGALHPFFAPDGRRLGFVSGGVIRSVQLSGGSPRDVAYVGASVQGVSWGDDDTMVFATTAGLWRVPASGGEPQVVAPADTLHERVYRWPDVLPGSRAAAHTVVTPTGFELASVSLESGEVRPLGIAGTSPRYVEPGRLVFGRIDGTLLSVPFDRRSLRIVGPVTQVVEGVHVGTQGASKLGVSTHALAYVPASPTDALVLVDRSGRAEAVPVRARSLRPTPQATAGGVEILLPINEPDATWANIWAIDPTNGDRRRITNDSGSVGPISHAGPPWRMAYGTSRAGRVSGFELRLLTEGRGSPEVLLPAASGQLPAAITPDGGTLVFQRLDAITQRDIWLLPLDGPRFPVPYLRGPANERAPDLSPDGRWLAWVSDESGRDEVYVGAFPERGRPVRISTSGGREPRWSPDGSELFYRGAGGMVAVPLRGGPSLEIGPHETLFDDQPYVAVANNAGYDVHPDGRFLMLRTDPPGEQVLVRLGWMGELPH
jgi:serine/threonine-protein kinase